MTPEKTTIDIVKALNELDFICIDVDKNDTYIYKMLNDIILLLEKVKKVEELLELYREKDRLFNKRSEMQFEDISIFSSHTLTLKIRDIKKKIEALEEELK